MQGHHSDAELDAQLKQVSTFNANDSLLHAATKDNGSKKAIKYFTMPVLGKVSGISSYLEMTSR